LSPFSAPLPFDAVSFDVDGTLYGLGRFKFELAVRHFADLATWIAMEKARKRIRREGAPAADMAAMVVERVAAELRQPEDAVGARIQRMLDVDWPAALARIGPSRGVVELLDALVGAGVPVVVLSDYPGASKLRGLGLSAYPWRAVVDATAVGALKPHPEAFRAAVRALGVEPGRVLHVGDSLELDVAGAASIGMQTALIGRSSAPPQPVPEPTWRFRSMRALSAAICPALQLREPR